MKIKIAHLLIVLVALTATSAFLMASSADAQFSIGSQAVDGKVEASHQISEENLSKSSTFIRRGGGQAKAAGFPSFAEVPHGNPHTLQQGSYIHSEWTRDGELVDVYLIDGKEVRWGTSYFK